MFPCEFCAIFKNIFFTEHLRMVVSVANYIILPCTCRSSHLEVFLEKDVLKTCSKFAVEQPYRNVISIKLLCNFIEITLRDGCSPVNLLHIFRTSCFRKTSGWLLLKLIFTFFIEDYWEKLL